MEVHIVNHLDIGYGKTNGHAQPAVDPDRSGATQLPLEAVMPQRPQIDLKQLSSASNRLPICRFRFLFRLAGQQKAGTTEF